MSPGALLTQAVELEAQRTARTGRGFTLVRVAPVGWAALEGEVDALARLVQAELRRTDVVGRARGREVGALLVDAVGPQAQAALLRLQASVAARMPELQVRMGFAAVGPGHYGTWQEAWRWAGALLVADAALPAAA